MKFSFKRLSSNKVFLIKPTGEKFSFDIDSFISNVEIREAQVLFENIVSSKFSKGINDSVDIYNIRVYPWWLYSRKIYEDVCIGIPKYNSLLNFLLENRENVVKIYAHDKRLRELLTYYTAYHDLKQVRINESFFYHIKQLIASFIKLFLSILSIKWIFSFYNERTLVFTSNRFFKTGMYDYRFSKLMPYLDSKRLKYILGIRTLDGPYQIFKHYILRRKPAIFFDVFIFFNNVFGPQNLKKFDRGNFPNFMDFMADYSVCVNEKGLIRVIKIYRNILRLCKIEKAFIADNCERSNLLILACRTLNINTVGAQNGTENIFYNVQKFNHFSRHSDFAFMSQNIYGVWSSGVKDYYSKYSKVYDAVEIAGHLRNDYENKFGNSFKLCKIKKVCFFIEVHTRIDEIRDYISATLSLGFDVYLKTDPTKPKVSELYCNQLLNELSHPNLKVSSLIMDEAINEFDLFIGAFTTALIDALAGFKPILLITSTSWGNYFHLDEITYNDILISSIDSLKHRILSLDKVDYSLVRGYFVNDNSFAPKWIHKKLVGL